MDNNQGLKPGSFLRHDTYRIEKVLGQGGFGITYLAVDLNLDRYVAIKEFFPKDYCDRDATSHVTLGTQSSKEFVYKLKAKFLKEARNIAKFDNPGIIRIHSAFEENNTAYYVMDYIEGLTLTEIVRKDGPIPEQKALRYISKVGRALEYVHEHNLTHLDVKPANIIIRDTDEEPILIDFGLAKQYDAKGQQTSTTPIGISHGYAPMEQYNDGGVKEFSPQTDLYSLGATLYYILSGVVPPPATKLIEDELTFPQGISPRLIKPISKAMAASRKKRHESVPLFLDELAAAEAQSEAAPVAAVVAEPAGNHSQPGKNHSGTAHKIENMVKDAARKIPRPGASAETKIEVHDGNASGEKKFPKWMFAAAVALGLLGAGVYWLLKPHDAPAPAGQELVATATPFSQALTMLDAYDADSVAEGFKRMKALAPTSDSAKIELGLTYFPYLPETTREDSLNNLILRRRLFLRLNSTTDGDSVFKYLGQVRDLPPEAVFLLGCNYYEHRKDAKKAVALFEDARLSLEKGTEVGHGFSGKNIRKSIDVSLENLR